MPGMFLGMCQASEGGFSPEQVYAPGPISLLITPTVRQAVY